MDEVELGVVYGTEDVAVPRIGGRRDQSAGDVVHLAPRGRRPDPPSMRQLAHRLDEVSLCWT